MSPTQIKIRISPTLSPRCATPSWSMKAGRAGVPFQVNEGFPSRCAILRKYQTSNTLSRVLLSTSMHAQIAGQTRNEESKLHNHDNQSLDYKQPITQRVLSHSSRNKEIPSDKVIFVQ